MRLLTRRQRHIPAPAHVLTALFAATFLFTIASVAAPSNVLGATTLAAKCDGVSLRTKASTSSTRKAVLASGVQVYAVTNVTGGRWRLTCAGRSYSGNTWYRISNVNGKSARSRYGVSYVYAATALFKSVTSYPFWTACDNVALRTRPSTSSTRKALLPDGAKVAVVARVSGSPWQVNCNGVTDSGSTWFRISYVNSKSSSSRYGLPYVYAASGLFTSTAPPSSSTTPKPTPAPTPKPSTGTSVRVTSIAALLSALDDNSVTDIVVANGTYRVSAAAAKRSDSLWIGARFADRTKAVTVHAETRGGVTFDGGGGTYFGGLSFEDGAHHQTWDGFRFANGEPTQTGVIVFGGAGGGYVGLAAPHHITLRSIKIAGSVTSTYAGSGDHSIYFSQAVGGPHDILVDGLTVDGSGGVNTALTFYHSDATHRNAWNVTVRNLTVSGTYQAVEIWDSTIRNLTIEGARITNARSAAVRYELGSAITLKDIVSTGSPGGRGFYSSKGSNPPGVTFINDSFH